jgi:hypothetical protein
MARVIPQRRDSGQIHVVETEEIHPDVGAPGHPGAVIEDPDEIGTASLCQTAFDFDADRAGAGPDTYEYLQRVFHGHLRGDIVSSLLNSPPTIVSWVTAGNRFGRATP